MIPHLSWPILDTLQTKKSKFLANVDNPIETIQDQRINFYPSKIDLENRWGQFGKLCGKSMESMEKP